MQNIGKNERSMTHLSFLAGSMMWPGFASGSGKIKGSAIIEKRRVAWSEPSDTARSIIKGVKVLLRIAASLYQARSMMLSHAGGLANLVGWSSGLASCSSWVAAQSSRSLVQGEGVAPGRDHDGKWVLKSPHTTVGMCGLCRSSPNRARHADGSQTSL